MDEGTLSMSRHQDTCAKLPAERCSTDVLVEIGVKSA
jgi:hypothetical protein